jgi:hypothetical protein
VSPVTVEQMAIRIDLAQLGFPYHTTYVDQRHTYINPHLDPPKQERVQRYLRAQYL